MEGCERVSEQILSELKNHLDITYSDPDTNKKICNIAVMGMHRIDDLAGTAQDYENDPEAWMLLVNFVRYEMNGVMHLWEKNFSREILEFVIDKEAKDYAAGSGV